MEDASVEGGVQTLVDLLAIAGGTNENAADYLYVVKNKSGSDNRIRVDLVGLLKQGNLDFNAVLDGGDVVLVPEMDVFYIYGQVESPGRYRLEPDMTVMQAISVASGLSDRGSEKGISLKRGGSNKEGLKSLNADLTDRLQAGDVIYVKEGLF
jgi:polysaccharide export outer membrane protein